MPICMSSKIVLLTIAFTKLSILLRIAYTTPNRFEVDSNFISLPYNI